MARTVQLLAVVLLVASGCGNSSEAVFSKHLVITLRVEPNYKPQRAAFYVSLDTTGPTLWPGGREIVVHDRGVRLVEPRDFGYTLRNDHVLPDVGRGFAWYFDHDALADWLEPSAEHRIHVTIGQVASNVVVLAATADGYQVMSDD